MEKRKEEADKAYLEKVADFLSYSEEGSPEEASVDHVRMKLEATIERELKLLRDDARAERLGATVRLNDRVDQMKAIHGDAASAPEKLVALGLKPTAAALFFRKASESAMSADKAGMAEDVLFLKALRDLYPEEPEP